MAFRSHYALPRRHVPSDPRMAVLAVIHDLIAAKLQAADPWNRDHYLQVTSIDTVNHWVYLKRQGDTAANNGFNYRYLSSYTPTVNDWVIVEYAPSGPYVKGKLA